MTSLHYEAMKAEVEYRHEQARKSWSSRAPKSRAGPTKRLWKTLAQWTQRLTASNRPDQTPAANISTTQPSPVQVHITCWTDGSPAAHQISCV